VEGFAVMRELLGLKDGPTEGLAIGVVDGEDVGAELLKGSFQNPVVPKERIGGAVRDFKCYHVLKRIAHILLTS
jgi:hypothetical protein